MSTKESAFFVSDRKIMSGEIFLRISFSRWTVMGFPKPQQFQLRVAKEEETTADENPSAVVRSPELIVSVVEFEICWSLPYHSSLMIY